MLFVGPLDCALTDFTIRYMQLLFCKKRISAVPCLQCIDCQMAARHEHPDVEWIKPDKSGGSIKIDQIRELQNTSYLTPQRAAHRVIVIESADRMNTAAANSLLKILEEPARHTLFLLLAQQLGSLLPTVLSRCQILRFAADENSSATDFLQSAEKYPQDSEHALIIKQSEIILDGLIALIERREHPCVLATQWTRFGLSTLLWFLYLVYSQLQVMHFNKSDSTSSAVNQLIKLTSLLSPVIIFAQLDKINTLQRQLNHNMNVNHTLALEDLLLDLQGGQ